MLVFGRYSVARAGRTLVYRPPVFDQVIQDGGKLVVRCQSAVFQKEGQISDAFGLGTCELSTRTPAIWGFFQSIKYGLNNPYKGDVFFLNTRIQRDQNGVSTVSIERKNLVLLNSCLGTILSASLIR